jgi:hypothetical protein
VGLAVGFIILAVGGVGVWLLASNRAGGPAIGEQQFQAGLNGEQPGAEGQQQGVLELLHPPGGGAGNGPALPKGDKDTVILAGKVADVAVGGGGRYLILHLADEKKLAIFDIFRGKVAHTLPLAENVIHFAAGAKKLVLLYPNARLLQVWDLATYKKERSSNFPDSMTRDDIHQVSMGSASSGPLFVYLPKEKRTLALDLTRLDTTEVRWNHYGPSNAYGPLHMRTAPDGNTLLGWHGGWAGLDMATFKDGRQLGAIDKFEFCMGVFALPSADGQLIFTPWAIVTRDMATAKVPELKNAYLVPAHEPGYFLALHSAGNGELPLAPGGPKESAKLPPVGEVAVYTHDRKKLFSVEDCAELQSGSDLHWEKRVHYYPRSGLMITVDKDRLVLRRVNLIERLQKSGANFLVVLSQPPLARAGTAFSYKLAIRSKNGGVKAKLESGPDGLKVTPDGTVTWAVPANFAQAEADVLLTLTDASAQEVFHKFKIVLADR